MIVSQIETNREAVVLFMSQKAFVIEIFIVLGYQHSVIRMLVFSYKIASDARKVYIEKEKRRFLFLTHMI